MTHRFDESRHAPARVAALGMVVALAGAPAAMAEESAQPAASAATEASSEEPARVRARRLGQQLGQIRQAALTENPELRDKQEAFQAAMLEKMRAAGHTPREDVARLREIREEAQEGDLSRDEQVALIREYQQLRVALATAQREALRDADIREAQQAYQSELVAAMREQEPDVDHLIEQFREVRQELITQQRSGGTQN